MVGYFRRYAFVMVLMIVSSCNKYEISTRQKETFIKYYPNEFLENNGINVFEISQGHYVILGNSLVTGNQGDHHEIMIIFTDEYGNKTDHSPVFLGSDGDDFGHSMIPVDDGYILAGSSEISVTKTAYFVKFSTTGQVIWEKNYASYEEQEMSKIIESGDGGFMAVGYCVNASAENKVYLMKINAMGDSIWSRTIGLPGSDDVGSSLIKSQNRYLIVGSSTAKATMNTNSRLAIFNTDLNGNNVTSTRIAGDYDLEGEDIILDSNEDIIVMGNQFVPFSSERQIYLGHITLGGTSNELINIGNSEFMNSSGSLYGEQMIPLESGSLALAGWRSRQNDIDILFAIVDQNFQFVALNFFGASGYQATFGLTQGWDESFILTGSAEIADSKSCMLMKLDASGEF
jgi:hypothetical protein